MVRVLAATRSIHKQPPVFLSPYGTEPTFFFFMCRFLHSSLYFLLPVRAPAPTPCLSLYVTGLAWANKDDYSEWLA